MRALIIIFFWLILGYLYWNAKDNCCENVLSSTAPVSMTTTDKKTALPTADTSANSGLIAVAKSDESNNENEITSIILEEENTTFFFMEEEFAKKNIPAELNAQLEKISKRMSGGIGSIFLVSYSDDKLKSKRWIRYAEDFLIKKGIIPNRIKVIRNKQGNRESEILELVIRE